MKLTPAEHLPFLSSLYYTYLITGPFVTLQNIPYFVLTSKADPSLVRYMSYAYGLLTNKRRKLLRPNQSVGFRDGNPTNCNKSNLKSIVINDPSPMLGWGIFSDPSALNEHSSGKFTPHALTTGPAPTPSTPKIKEIAPDYVVCAGCGKPLLLNRFQKYRYANMVSREFVHNECKKQYLDLLRKRGLRVRQMNAELRTNETMLDLKLTHYAAKPKLGPKEVSMYGEAYFEAHYKDVGKDYLPKEVLTTTVERIPFGATARTIVPLIKSWLHITDELYDVQSGANFILFKRSGTPKDALKEFIHASW